MKLPRKFNGLHKELWNEMPEFLLRKLKTLDRRVLPCDLDSLIEDLCVWRALGLRELGEVLQRSPVYLQNTAVKRLLAEGRLHFLYSGEPHHPRQAYRSAAALPVETSPNELDIGRND